MFLSIPTPAPQALAQLNETTARFRLSLSAPQAAMLARHEEGALRQTGRVDFGGGILRPLALAFADSPYVSQSEWAQTLGELLELFYAFKAETHDLLSDAELLAAMARIFNERAHGSISALADCREDDLLRAARGDLPDAPGGENAEDDHDD